MKETIEEYVQRIQSKIQGKDPLKVQAATAKKLEQLLKRAAPSRLRKRPAPDKWSVAEVLAHLSETEIVTGWRLRTILSSPGAPIQPYDQDVWASEGQYAKRDPSKSLVRFRVLREANLELLKSLSAEQRKRFGLHAERGEESIERLALLIAGHDINHIEQIEAIVAVSAAARGKHPATSKRRSRTRT
jgi:DinB superfamily